MKSKIIIGTANFYTNYGILKKKAKNIFKLIDFLNKKNIRSFDISNSYNLKNNILNYLIKERRNIFYLKLDINKFTSKKGKINFNKIDSFINIFPINQISSLSIHNISYLNNDNIMEIIKYIKSIKKINKKINLGVSIYSLIDLKKILKYNFQTIQIPLNIFNQEFNKENIIRLLKRKKIKIHCRSLFLQGILLKENSTLPNYFKQWQDHFEKYDEQLKITKSSKIQYNMNFASTKKWVDRYVIGITNIKELNEIINFKRKKIQLRSFEELESADKKLIDPRFWIFNEYNSNDKSQKLWNKAKSVILNGNMLLSKRPEMFLPKKWPTYYKKTQDCFVWGLDKKKYLDMTLMGVGTNILGYNNKNVDKKVLETINLGNLSTLNSPEEVELSQKLLSIHPWADKTHFTRSGGEANAVAVRIARAATKSEKIAICGYHGWHDWYLAANLTSKNILKNHLLNGLSTNGVPSNLKNTVFPFLYNDINYLKKLVKKENIKIIKMEVSRNQGPKNNFLNKVKNLCKKNKIILIFDECTSGFRENFGGLHLKYKINPDLAIFGKALGNGYAINAIIGNKETMIKAQESFISSTFWTERIGSTAALATLKEMERIKSWEIIKKTGKKIKKKWKELATKYNLKIIIEGLDSLASFRFDSDLNLLYKTYITQEMLKKKILASNSIYSCIHHHKHLGVYFKNLDIIFKDISEFETGKKNIYHFLSNEVCNSTFSRLN